MFRANKNKRSVYSFLFVATAVYVGQNWSKKWHSCVMQMSKEVKPKLKLLNFIRKVSWTSSGGTMQLSVACKNGSEINTNNKITEESALKTGYLHEVRNEKKTMSRDDAKEVGVAANTNYTHIHPYMLVCIMIANKWVRTSGRRNGSGLERAQAGWVWRDDFN